MRSLAVLFAGVMSAAVVAPQTADACIHGERYRPQVNPTLRDVRRAEHLLAKSRFKSAAKLARQAFAQVAQLSPEEDSVLFDRAQRVAALAIVRSDGKVELGRKLSRGEQGTQQRLAWAALALQYQQARYADNMVVRAQYAESLHSQPIMQPVALAILADLHDRDVVPTARAYAQLAKLHLAKGDEAGRDLALVRCREIAGDVNSVCRVA